MTTERVAQYGGIVVDRRERGLVQVVFPQRDIEDDELRAYLSGTEAQWRQQPSTSEALVVVVDIGAKPRLTTTQRKMQADFMNANRQRIAKTLRGYAYIITDAVPRTLLRGLMWLAPPPCPSRTFEVRDEALRWARARLTDPR